MSVSLPKLRTINLLGHQSAMPLETGRGFDDDCHQFAKSHCFLGKVLLLAVSQQDGLLDLVAQDPVFLQQVLDPQQQD